MKDVSLLICFDLHQTITSFNSQKDLTLMARVGARSDQFGGVGIVINGRAVDSGFEYSDSYNPEVTVIDTKTILKEKGEEGFRKKEQLCIVMERLIQDGHKLAITSYSQFPDSIPVILQEMGLTPEIREQIINVTGFPEHRFKNSPHYDGKQKHLAAAMQHYGITDTNKVILMDDSAKNCKLAYLSGYNAVYSPKGRPTELYLQELMAMVERVSKCNVII